MATETLTQNEFSVCYVRPESRQLFFLFTGLAGGAVHALDFIGLTGIGDRNIVIFKDRRSGNCYQQGVSEEYDSLDGIVRWQREQLAGQFAHVREVFCAGSSAGGPPAIHTASRLGGRAAWSISGRIVTPTNIDDRKRVSAELYRRVIGRSTLDTLTPDEYAKLVEALNEPETRKRRWDLVHNPETVTAHAQVAAMVDVVRANTAPTDLHFYYATTNAIDVRFAQAFRDCPRVACHPVTLPPMNRPEDTVSFSEPDHGILPMLIETGQLRAMFADYL